MDAKLVLDGLRPGDSVSIDGVCLTVTEVGSGSFSAEATEHTLSASTLKDMQTGSRANLERALRVGDRLGGHIVQGHVDGVGRVTRLKYQEGSAIMQVAAPRDIHHLLIGKGSVALNGVSLTIAEKIGSGFSVMLIPYTLEHTTLGELKPGDSVNLETDLILRWLADRFPEAQMVTAALEEGSAIGEFHLED